MSEAGLSARQQPRHARLPLAREGQRPHDRLQPDDGRGRDRAAPLRRRRPARRGRRQPRQHVQRRRSALLGDDEHDPAPGRTGSGEFFAYFADPFGFAGTLLLYFGDVFLEWRAARRQRRAGAERVNRGGLYPWMRATITVAMRDLNVALLMGDIIEGIPVVYSTFVGYDEVAHHSGVVEPDAFAVLRRHDAELARLSAWRGGASPLPPGRPLRPRSDPGPALPPAPRAMLEELVERAMGGVDVFAPASVDEGFATVGGALTEARAEDSVAGRVVARATRGRLVDGEVALGSNRAAMEQMRPEESAGSPAIVLASGGLGLITLSASRERMSVGEIGDSTRA